MLLYVTHMLPVCFPYVTHICINSRHRNVPNQTSQFLYHIITNNVHICLWVLDCLSSLPCMLCDCCGFTVLSMHLNVQQIELNRYINVPVVTTYFSVYFYSQVSKIISKSYITERRALNIRKINLDRHQKLTPQYSVSILEVMFLIL